MCVCVCVCVYVCMCVCVCVCVCEREREREREREGKVCDILQFMFTLSEYMYTNSHTHAHILSVLPLLFPFYRHVTSVTTCTCIYRPTTSQPAQNRPPIHTPLCSKKSTTLCVLVLSYSTTIVPLSLDIQWAKLVNGEAKL